MPSSRYRFVSSDDSEQIPPSIMPRRARLPNPSATAAIIQKRSELRPTIGLVLGSGFGGVTAAMTIEREFAYRDLPGFPTGTVPGHAGRLLIGAWQGVPLAVLSGRAHYYEGFEMAESTYSIRVLAELGIQTVLLTNAAGGINPKFKIGDYMVLSDHINLMGFNPLRGPETNGLNRFVDLSAAYDPELRGRALAAGKQAKVKVHTGVYLAVCGPSFETPAEIRAFNSLGADAVGMSTVPETIVARQHGLRVLGISCITNAAAGLGGEGHVVSHLDVMELAEQRQGHAVRLLSHLIPELPT